MPQYTVRSGQNIYDVALTLHGSVEGIFDLLASNKELTMETKLSNGMVLNYHDEFVVNGNIARWLKENNIIVKNGEHTYIPLDIEELVQNHIKEQHRETYHNIEQMSPNEQDIFWKALYTPRMLIHQQGVLSTIRCQLKTTKHLIIDWGDYSAPQIIENDDEDDIEHCYKGVGSHIITFFGDFDFSYLNLLDVNGVHYPLDVIVADRLETYKELKNHNKLIITQ